MRITLALLVTTFSIGSGCLAMDDSREIIFHINSFRVPCVGVAPMNCLQVQRGDPAPGKWQYFYDQIDGFEFEPGFRYRLLVRETPLPQEQIPADASSMRYELIEIIEKTPDPNSPIHDIWVLERVDGTPVKTFDPASHREQPYIEFDIVRGKYRGNDGCNSIEGDLTLSEAPALRLVAGGSQDDVPTCGDGMLQARIAAALARVAAWQRDGRRLALMDDNGLEVLSFGKTD